MPYLHLQTVKGLLSPEQKRTLMDKFSAVLIEVEGGNNPDFRKNSWIRIEEEQPQHWQLGELRPTTQFIERMVQMRDEHCHPK